MAGNETARQSARGRALHHIKAVEAADQGDELADAAFRDIAAELQMSLLQGRDLAPGHLQVIAYYQRVHQRAPHKRKRGSQWYDHWVRNLGICILVRLLTKHQAREALKRVGGGVPFRTAVFS